MDPLERSGAPTSAAYILLLLILACSLGFMLSMDPLAQDPSYHHFADQRAYLGVPNFLDVISNGAFLAAGGAGVMFLARYPAELRIAWVTFAGGVVLVGAGSAYYHVNPDNATLFWDRLPITSSFPWRGLLHPAVRAPRRARDRRSAIRQRPPASSSGSYG